MTIIALELCYKFKNINKNKSDIEVISGQHDETEHKIAWLTGTKQ